MSRKIIQSLTIAIAFLFSVHSVVLAQTTPPSFPSCTNPTGTVKVSYPSGTHGIPGNTSSFSGSDTVYDLGSGNHVQCFCAEDGNGIQTNWWNVNSLTGQEIDILLSQGWTFIPTGVVWGLEDDPYLVQNANYSCSGGTNGSTSDNGSGGGTVAGTSTSIGSVLGLAATGGILPIFILGSLGFISLSLGLYLKKEK
ncbi:hypothetical protein HYW54_02130 [Candidatus Gottesmanbacteria bacterium]|nr:hypothetical protein [Candidatus Gottesmanbacteria bacterium]